MAQEDEGYAEQQAAEREMDERDYRDYRGRPLSQIDKGAAVPRVLALAAGVLLVVAVLMIVFG